MPDGYIWDEHKTTFPVQSMIYKVAKFSKSPGPQWDSKPTLSIVLNHDAAPGRIDVIRQVLLSADAGFSYDETTRTFGISYSNMQELISRLLEESCISSDIYQRIQGDFKKINKDHSR